MTDNGRFQRFDLWSFLVAGLSVSPPRLADAGVLTFWRVDNDADYVVLFTCRLHWSICVMKAKSLMKGMNPDFLH
ncbi:hypothetical protein [Tenebrionicola larvae]|uniref:hypothetical protein n=1 Tax=Tenebrionicola larvae TaxID=2815733 RepID=UPI0037D9B967